MHVCVRACTRHSRRKRPSRIIGCPGHGCHNTLYFICSGDICDPDPYQVILISCDDNVEHAGSFVEFKGGESSGAGEVYGVGDHEELPNLLSGLVL